MSNWYREDGAEVLAIMLRATAEAIETKCPSMKAHARLMLEAAAEINRMDAETKAAQASLAIALRKVADA
jgi:hypothetical protein